MKKMLIAMDYDPSSIKVAKVGFSMAKDMNAEVILLHIISDPSHYSSSKHVKILGFSGQKEIVPLLLDVKDGLKKIARIFLDKIKGDFNYKNAHTVVKIGNCAESILKVSKNRKVDIIVIGSHSRKKLENVAMGSVAIKVLLQTTIPLFIVPIRS